MSSELCIIEYYNVVCYSTKSAWITHCHLTSAWHFANNKSIWPCFCAILIFFLDVLHSFYLLIEDVMSCENSVFHWQLPKNVATKCIFSFLFFFPFTFYSKQETLKYLLTNTFFSFAEWSVWDSPVKSYGTSWSKYYRFELYYFKIKLAYVKSEILNLVCVLEMLQSSYSQRI